MLPMMGLVVKKLKRFRNLISKATPACGLDYDGLKKATGQVLFGFIHSATLYSSVHKRHRWFGSGALNCLSCRAEP